MIYAQPGSTFEAFLHDAPTGLVGTLTYRLVDDDGTVHTAESTAGITEPLTGVYRREDTAPDTKGTYLIVWLHGTTQVVEELVVTSALPVVGEATGQALTTLAAVREFLQKTGGDTGQDAVISQLITRASVAILNHTGREFAPVTNGATRTFDYGGGGLLRLEPFDVRMVTSVRRDVDTSPVLLATGDYRPWPNPAPEGAYPFLKLAVDDESVVEVTGDWGFPSVPVDVQHACIITVVTWLRADVSAFSTTFRLDDERLERPEALPSAVVATLDHWRFRTLVA